MRGSVPFRGASYVCGPRLSSLQLEGPKGQHHMLLMGPTSMQLRAAQGAEGVTSNSGCSHTWGASALGGPTFLTSPPGASHLHACTAQAPPASPVGRVLLCLVHQARAPPPHPSAVYSFASPVSCVLLRLVHEPRALAPHPSAACSCSHLSAARPLLRPHLSVVQALKGLVFKLWLRRAQTKSVRRAQAGAAAQVRRRCLPSVLCTPPRAAGEP